MIPSVDDGRWRDLVLFQSPVKFTGLATRLLFTRLRLISGRDEQSLLQAVREAHDFFVRNEVAASVDLERAFGRDVVRPANVLVRFEEVANRIRAGATLALAGSEKLLKQLPNGRWVGGTIPYFMGPSGGTVTDELIFLTELPAGCLQKVTIATYEVEHLPTLPSRTPAGGFSLVVLPAFSAVHLEWGRNSQSFPGLLNAPLLGWVSGHDLRPGQPQTRPLVFDGTTGTSWEDRAVALHVAVDSSVVPRVDIVNIFKQGTGPRVQFLKGGFSTEAAMVDGKVVEFGRWLRANQVDTRLPLVADYSGAHINVSFREVNASTREVSFFAPVFPEMEYRLAEAVGDYSQAFSRELASRGGQPAFACNCVVNFEHGKLEGRSTGTWQGPMSFGEIAWMLMNQTMAYLTLEKV